MIDTRARTTPDTETLRPVQRAGPRRTLGVILAAFALGALLNARPLADTAATQPLGWQRDVAIAVTNGLVEMSDALGLDEPHEWADAALDRDGAPAPDGEPPSTDGVFVPTADQPARLWIAGDSLTDTVGPAVVNQAAATAVIEPRLEVQYSSGLTRPELYDWPGNLAAGLSENPADIMVFMVGANDGQPIQTPSGWASFATPEWNAEYATRVGATMDLLTERVATVYWVGQPIPRDAMQAQRVSVMNAIYETSATRRPDVRFIDAWALFADADGSYSAYLPDASGRRVQVRDPDGVHLTPAGAELLATEILTAIAQDWNIDLR